jgi:hypothetical protein
VEKQRLVVSTIAFLVVALLLWGQVGYPKTAGTSPWNAMAHLSAKPEVVSHNRKCRDLRTTGSLQEYGASVGLSKLKCLWIHSLAGCSVDYRPEVVCPCLFLYNDD